MKRLALMLTLWLGLAASLTAQEDDTEYRMEFGAGIGTGFGINDVNTKAYGDAALAGGALLRFVLNPRMAVKILASCSKTKGSADNVANFYPATPGGATTERLSHEAEGLVAGLAGLYEIHFLPYGYEKGYQGYKRLTPYLQIGLGMAYGSRAKAATADVPIGAGLKWKIGPRLNFGFDWLFHFSLSDKLDGLEAPTGIKSKMFRNKDHFNTTLLTLTYSISPRCPTCNKD
ncbi:MAG: hypothetical protein J1F06_00635 [Prevotellaceae bacterium]|nr:hypothetical protein [Prevotellaceae bacterium]